MSLENKKRGKKRPKSYYKKCANVKRKKLNVLEAGLKGFIVTCCDREKEAIRESYSILNEYADQIYGPEKIITNVAGNEEQNDEDDDDGDDIEKAMTKEVDEIKEIKTVERRFQRLESKTKNCIFIKTILENPRELAEKIFQDLMETKVQKSRYAMRLLPVEGTCKANLDEIKKLGQNLFSKYFATPYGEGVSFSITFKARNNNSIGRDSVIPELSHMVTELNPSHTVEHDNPDYIIFIQVLCTVCCFSVLKNFTKFKKYNLQEVVKDVEGDKSKEITESTKGNNTDNSTKDGVVESSEAVGEKDVVDDIPIPNKCGLTSEDKNSEVGTVEENSEVPLVETNSTDPEPS